MVGHTKKEPIGGRHDEILTNEKLGKCLILSDYYPLILAFSPFASSPPPSLPLTRALTLSLCVFSIAYFFFLVCCISCPFAKFIDLISSSLFSTVADFVNSFPGNYIMASIMLPASSCIAASVASSVVGARVTTRSTGTSTTSVMKVRSFYLFFGHNTINLLTILLRSCSKFWFYCCYYCCCFGFFSLWNRNAL